MPTNQPDGRRESAKFGGSQFTQELESQFAASAALLESFLDAEIGVLPHPVGMLTASVHQSAKALLALAPDGLVLEANLVMRVLVDTALTAAYMSQADESERERYLTASRETNCLNDTAPANLVRQATTMMNFEGIGAHCAGPVLDRIDAVCAKTGSNPDPWKVIAASIFPPSANLLAGSATAYATWIKARHSPSADSGLGGEFSQLFLFGTNVLCELITTLCRPMGERPWTNSAKTIREHAFAVMKVRSTGIEDPASNAWNGLDRFEHFGIQRLKPHLLEFEEAFAFAYEAALLAPTLRPVGSVDSTKLSGLYLRRALNDLRTVWLMLERGYTAQASTAAGSLYESSLACICLLNPVHARSFQDHLGGPTGNDFPWGAMKMTQMACAQDFDVSQPNAAYENSWRALYARYVWLSQIRHSTFQSVIHEAKASTLDCGNYAIMAIPNCKDDDLPVKLGIAVGALSDILDATDAFVSSFGFSAETGNMSFDARRKNAGAALDSLIQRFSETNNPITVARTKFAHRHPPVPCSSQP